MPLQPLLEPELLVPPELDVEVVTVAPEELLVLAVVEAELEVDAVPVEAVLAVVEVALLPVEVDAALVPEDADVETLAETELDLPEEEAAVELEAELVVPPVAPVLAVLPAEPDELEELELPEHPIARREPANRPIANRMSSTPRRRKSRPARPARTISTTRPSRKFAPQMEVACC